VSGQQLPRLREHHASNMPATVLSDWQRVVDALVVAGVARLAPYSEKKPRVKPRPDECLLSFAIGSEPRVGR
jgi:hypothetical protein